MQPRAASDAIELVNLHPAGDHCRSHVDLVCMEGAVTSGLKAADAVQRAEGRRRPVRIRKPQLPAW